jgi:hypothetical protein
VKPLHFSFLILLVVLVTTNGYGNYITSIHDTTNPCDKLSRIQVANYKPKPAKNGKNGDQRIAIMLLRGAKRGGDGKDGKNAPDLLVHISLLHKDSDTLKVIVKTMNSDKQPDNYYVNAVTGELNIIADGGSGGDGGEGENGLPADGKKLATSGGYGGYGGKGGNGGNIRVIFDSSATKYANCLCLSFSNRAGMGGSGGNGGWDAGEFANERSEPGKPGKDGDPGLPVTLENDKGVVIAIRRGKPYEP